MFGWRGVHQHDDALVGKKQDKAGRWRLANVPPYSANPLHAYAIEDRMKQLGRLDRYQKELSRIARAENIPAEWATPDQRCRAAIKAVGQYGQVVPLHSAAEKLPELVLKYFGGEIQEALTEVTGAIQAKHTRKRGRTGKDHK